jgi:hypothetical protein
MTDGAGVTLHHAAGHGAVGRHGAIAGGDTSRRMMACEAATGWTVPGKAAARRSMAGKAVPSTARCRMQGMEAAARPATRMKAAAMKSSGGAHAAWMEATPTGMEAAAARMEAASAGMKAATTTRVEAASATAVETSATTVEAAAATAAAGSRVRQVSECEACNCARKDCSEHPGDLSTGNAHVGLHSAEGGSETPATPLTSAVNSLVRAAVFFRNRIGRQ